MLLSLSTQRAAGANFVVLNAVLNRFFCISESSNLKFSPAAPLTLARTAIYGTNIILFTGQMRLVRYFGICKVLCRLAAAGSNTVFQGTWDVPRKKLPETSYYSRDTTGSLVLITEQRQCSQ